MPGSPSFLSLSLLTAPLLPPFSPPSHRLLTAFSPSALPFQPSSSAVAASCGPLAPVRSATPLLHPPEAYRPRVLAKQRQLVVVAVPRRHACVRRSRASSNAREDGEEEDGERRMERGEVGERWLERGGWRGTLQLLCAKGWLCCSTPQKFPTLISHHRIMASTDPHSHRHTAGMAVRQGATDG